MREQCLCEVTCGAALRLGREGSLVELSPQLSFEVHCSMRLDQISEMSLCY